MKHFYSHFSISDFAPFVSKKISLAIILAGFLFSGFLQGQSVCNYTVTGPNPGVTIDVGGVSITLGDNQVSGALPVGFNFNFFGTAYSQFYLSSNGFLTFDVASPDGCCLGQVLPNPGTPNNLIAAAWQNLNPAAGGTIGYNTFGLAPNRRLVISYNQVMHFGGANPVTFQIKLFESTDRIEIHTISQPANTAGHTQGLENQNGTVGIPVPGRNSTAWTTSNETVVFQPVPFVLNTSHTDVLCNGGTTGTITASSTGGVGSISYTNNNGVSYQGSGNFAGLIAGSYIVIGRDANTCLTLPTTVVVTEPPPIVVNAGNDTVVCDGSSVTIPATASGGFGTLTPSWTNGATLNNAGILNPAASPTVNTIYTLTITDANNCTATDALQVIVNPTPTATSSGLAGPVCSNTSVQTLTGSPLGGVFSGPGMTGAVFDPATAGGGTHTISYIYTNAFNCSDTSDQTVTVYAAPVATVTGLNPNYCEFDPAVTLTVNPTGGNLSGPGIGGLTFTPQTAGVGVHTITYIYTDANSCTDTATAGTTVNSVPNVFMTGLLPNYCLNSASATLIGNPGGGTFSGPGVSGNIFSPSGAGLGTHTITYIYANASGCSDTAYQNVTVNGLPVVSFTGLPTAMCSEDPAVTLVGSPTGGVFTGTGVNGFLYEPLLAGAGTHNVTYNYTDVNGCSNTNTQSITVNTTPIVGFSGLNPTYCITDPPVTLNPSPIGGTLSGSGIIGTTFDPMAAGMGTHTISYSYTDANGCSNTFSTGTVVFNLPVVNLGNDTSFCFGNSITLDAGNPGSTYSWNTGPTSQTLTVNATGLFYVDVVTGGGCAGSDTINITTLQVPVVNLGQDRSICNGDTAIIDAGNPGDTYLWTPGGATTQTITVSSAGTYSVNVTNANNCSSMDAITISVVPNPIVNLGPDLTVCAGSPVNLNAGNPGSTYNWSTSSGSNIIQVFNTGTYWVEVTNSFGCMGTDTILVTFIPSPVASFTMNTSGTPTIVFTDNSTGNPTTWAWSFGDGGTSSSQNPTHTYSFPGTYTVNLSVSNQCGATNFSQTVIINDVGISSGGAPEGEISLFPNPGNGLVTLQLEGYSARTWNMKIMDVSGRLLQDRDISTHSSSYREIIDLTEEAKGIYFVRMESGATLFISKLIIR